MPFRTKESEDWKADRDVSKLLEQGDAKAKRHASRCHASKKGHADVTEEYKRHADDKPTVRRKDERNP